MDINISTAGRNCVGRWYPRPDRIMIHINIIAGIYDPIDDLEGFIGQFISTEFHELGHIFGFRSGCNPAHKCHNGRCWWCCYTMALKHWLTNNNVWDEDCKLLLNYYGRPWWV